MYTALLLVLLGIAAFLFIVGAQKKKTFQIIAGLTLAVLTVFFFWFMGFWGEALWFENLGYGQRFWTIFFSNSLFAVAGAALGWLLMIVFTLNIPKDQKLLRGGLKVFGIFVGGTWGFTNWDTILKFWDGVSTGLKDPILGRDMGFYLFTLPFLDQLYSFVFSLAIMVLIVVFFISFIRILGSNLKVYFPKLATIRTEEFTGALYWIAGIFLIILASGKFLERYDVMYSQTGVVTGPGWTDVHILLPAYIVVIILMLILAVMLLVPQLRARIQRPFRRYNTFPERSHFLVFVSTGVAVLAVWFIAFTVLPQLFERLVVRPNEITFERPYISNNIKFTRFAFGLNKIEEKQYPVSGSLTQQVVKQDSNLFSNIRLWDWRALDAVYKQFQAIRLYYEFSDVDVDRYHFADKYREVMVSAREMNITNLPVQSQTFVNKRFQYTHGYGITMATVNEFTSQGLPHLLIKDIPPKSEYPALDVNKPQIYYGEMTDSHVIVNTKEKEFDYPSGEDNVYTKYAGKGGVRMSSFWRKFLFGWKFDGTNFLFSDYPTDSSRIMFHRQIEERVKLLAPFLDFDRDPYVVLANGNLYWMIDAYTTSNYFPYTQPFSSVERIEYKEGNRNRTIVTQVGSDFEGINYIRNSVKAVINAYDGSVNFYVVDSTDAIIKVWSRIFPHLFKPLSQMPQNLQAHMRYPMDMLLIQGLTYEKYHMTDPTVFYNQEDLWVRATEKYYDHVQPVEPYYIMWQLPGSSKQQFVLMLPFTPKNRQVLIGWIAGMCDPGNYGRFLAYQFPKDKTVLGPQQVETKIDQDSYLSGQLTLWDQRGSNVIRGNVLAIPVNNTIFYVEPIYLQAETAAYPELRLVVVMQGENMSYANTFEQALDKFFGNAAPSAEAVQTTRTQPGIRQSFLDQVRQANDAFNNYLKYNGQKRFGDAAKELEKLQQTLQNLSNNPDTAGKK